MCGREGRALGVGGGRDGLQVVGVRRRRYQVWERVGGGRGGHPMFSWGRSGDRVYVCMCVGGGEGGLRMCVCVCVWGGACVCVGGVCVDVYKVLIPMVCQCLWK